MIILYNFPLPPSVNEYLVPVVSNKYSFDKKGKPYRKAHFVKSDIHRNYLKRCQEWKFHNNLNWLEVQRRLQEIKKQAQDSRKQFALRMDHYFAFEKSRLWTVNNLAQQIDCDNRMKPCRDAVANLLDIDDKYFFSGFIEKVSAPTKEAECTIIKITLMTPRTLEQVQAQMKLEASSL